MKKQWILFICALAIFGCQNQNSVKIEEEEKKELEKVESFKKTDKQKEDSVREYWEKKMDESKLGN